MSPLWSALLALMALVVLIWHLRKRAADRERLDEALVRAGEPPRPLTPAVFRVTPGGLALES